MIQKLSFDSDERGVSEVLGAILVFGILIVLLGIIQTQAVPAQNQEVEVKHTLDVQGDLIKFQQTTSEVAADGTERSVAFESGTGYPSRLLFFNPPRVQGTVETTEQEEVLIANVTATNGEVEEYLQDPKDSNANNITLDTRRLQYRVNYNELQSEPDSRFEYGLLYNYFEDEDEYIVQNNGNVIDGTTINLRFLAGNYSKTSGSEQSLNVQPVSAPARSVRVTGDSGDDINITLPTNLDLSVWQNQYAGGANVEEIRDGPGDSIVIQLDGSQTYDLQMSKLALETGVDEPDPYYIVPTRDGVTNAGPGAAASVQYEVRDVFNNPVSGAEVELPGGTTKTTNDEGRVSTTVTATSNTDVQAELTDSRANCGTPTADRCFADFTVQVATLSLNPTAEVTVGDTSTAALDLPGIDLDIGGVFTADNAIVFDLVKASSGSVNIEALRINHYHPNPDDHGDVTLEGPSGNTVEDIKIGGARRDGSDVNSLDPITNSPGEFSLAFEDEVRDEHFVVITLVFDNDERALYFISP